MTTATLTHHHEAARLHIRREHVEAGIAAVAYILLLPAATLVMAFLTA